MQTSPFPRRPIVPGIRPLLLITATTALLLAGQAVRGQSLEPQPLRLQNALTTFLVSEAGEPFELTLDVRDINHRVAFPGELLVKVEDPDGRVLLREVIPDDGMVSPIAGFPGSSWASEAWYYGTAYSRGLSPAVRWSAFSEPARLDGTPVRTFSWKIDAGKPGVYRVVVVGTSDHYVTLRTAPELPRGVAGNPEMLHGHGDLYRRSHIFVPDNATTINLWFMQLDQPARRTVTLRDGRGLALATADGIDGLQRRSVALEQANLAPGDLLTVEVSEGPGDFLLLAMFQLENQLRHERGSPAVTAVLTSDADAARAIQGGQILHDGLQFWQGYQVRMHEWLKSQPEEAFAYEDSDKRVRPVSVGSHHYPKRESADWLMHDYLRLGDRGMLFAALREMQQGMRLMNHSGHVGIGPRRNMAYEMGAYSFFYHRPAWRILQHSDAPDEVKAIIRDFVIQMGDRLAFARGTELGNGNALASLTLALAYCARATDDPLQKELFATYWDRFANGGFGERVGIGPSGSVQEAMGYGYHYASYPLRGWRAPLQENDLNDPRFREAYDRLLQWYSYVYAQGEAAAPWSSRTNLNLAGGTYNPDHPRFPWKGHRGPDLTESVMGADEWFVARREHYYAVTYHGRLSPTFNQEGFNGQIGFGGGILCQIHVPGKGQVLASTMEEQYGGGHRPAQWRNYHMHGLVGETADGVPLVAANSEHFNARLDPQTQTVTSSGEVRQSSVRVERSYQYNADRIHARVTLEPSAHDAVFSLFYGRPKLRAQVREAYEVFPVAYKVGRRMDAVMTALSADGSTIGELTAQPQEAAGFVIDQQGYGMRVEFDQPRRVMLGANRTVMVEVVSADGPVVEAADVTFAYAIAPFAGPPIRGPIGGVIQRRREVALPMIDAPASEDAPTPQAALDAAPLLTMDAAGGRLAESRILVRGDQLLLSTDVIDSQVQQNLDRPWTASCVEVFVSPADASGIAQVMLLPATGDDSPAAAILAGETPRRLEEARVVTRLTDRGYTLDASMPLSSFGLDADHVMEQGVLIELQVTGFQRRGRNHQVRRATQFGSEHAFEDNRVYAHFRVAADREGEGDQAVAE